jgi:hypothetical protein
MPEFLVFIPIPKGVAHWKVEAEIPYVGPMLTKFSTELSENSPDRVEWFPVAVETKTSSVLCRVL